MREEVAADMDEYDRGTFMDEETEDERELSQKVTEASVEYSRHSKMKEQKILREMLRKERVSEKAPA